MKRIDKVLPNTLDHAETIDAHQKRREHAKAMHRLAVARKVNRDWFDPSQAGNGRTQVINKLVHVRQDLLTAREIYPDYSDDKQMVNDITKVRRAIRILLLRLAPDRLYDQD